MERTVQYARKKPVRPPLSGVHRADPRHTPHGPGIDPDLLPKGLERRETLIWVSIMIGFVAGAVAIGALYYLAAIAPF